MKTEGKSKRGGARPNSGRKPKADYSVRELFKQAFDQEFQFEDWVKFIKTAKEDPKLMPYIIDQRIGKATQAIDLTNKGDALTKVTIVVKDTRNGDTNGGDQRLHEDGGSVKEV